ncbi:hypothetical protein BJP34_26395 [Moorena producens PAL-8-15-08-1]|uniref:NfeD-like C-terminal domain-containing protein n=2 Tax=Moorena TaxID=1155738 RepID=A0A1D8TXY6_9CYAN|nr:NfeD family protein [Moorena producens]AOX02502.1 hypothetical protein BJP34_26395 [Moorena producens PAL-8-15-08-1]NEO80414.1 hypothetical protein [Moorena sp. SIO4G3]
MIKVQAPDSILFPQPGVGKVERTITPTKPGRVKFKATYWPARLCDHDSQVTLMPDDQVTVVGRHGITLLVVPAGYISPGNSPDGEPEVEEPSQSQSLGWTQKLSSVFSKLGR